MRGKSVKVLVMSFVAMLLLSRSPIFAWPPPTEKHNAISMWIEPSSIFLTTANPAHTIGYRFNVTLFLNVTREDTYAFSIVLMYNRTQLKATRANFTAPPTSEFMEGHTTITVNLIDHPELGNGSVYAGETLLGVDFIPPHCASLFWIEFEVLMIPPPGETLNSTFDISSQMPEGDTFVWNAELEDILEYAYDSTYRFVAVDTIPPAIEILSPQNKTYTTSSILLTFTLNESTSWVGYSLDDQANVTITGNITLTDIPEGTHNVVVYANDTSGNMGCSDKVYFTVEITPLDLSVSSPDISFSESNPSEGQSVTISATIHNLGEMSAENTTIHFYDSVSLIGEDHISFISHHSHGTASIDWTADGEGYHLIKVVVDPFNDMIETDEDNNEATRSLLVGEMWQYGGIIVAGSISPNETYVGSKITVHGNAIYNTTYGAGEPVAGADVTVTIIGCTHETTHTIKNGSYTVDIDAPSFSKKLHRSRDSYGLHFLGKH